MSFKREGDDSSLLNVLKKRRVDELFAVDIPSDEALLTCNGRFACLVCHWKPVFDTVQMLAIHRNGKKHLAAQEDFNSRKSERNEEISPQKRPGTFLHRPNYDRRVQGKNSQKRSGASMKDLEKTRKELEEIERDNEDYLVNIKPYESKCKVSSTYVLPRYRMGDLGISNDSQAGTSFFREPRTALVWADSRDETLPSSENAEELPKWTQEQKELYVKYLEAGWKRTPTGEWVRDQDAEFESDEEPPNL